ncbi:transferrin-binding protein-like solute binding protein [Kingella kingae]|uniref:transferrin-binding protein-like solute binding protein n=1 Tax=Kingella kingae TaxID=504 RepID=UPI001E51CD69|nr:transferrin-binding protein-like solute binding protein [Kingella kingae]
MNSGDSSFMGKKTFNAVINGNRFASDSSSPNHKIEGGFYGAGAAEIAGKTNIVEVRVIHFLTVASAYSAVKNKRNNSPS